MAITKVYTKDVLHSVGSVPISKGGTGARGRRQAAKNLGLVTEEMKRVVNGVAILDEDALVRREDLPLSFSDVANPSLVGKDVLYLDGELIIEITNFDGFSDYAIDDSLMPYANWERNGDFIKLTPNGLGVGMQTIKVNHRNFHFEVSERKPERPAVSNLDGSIVGNVVQVTTGISFMSFTFDSSQFVDESNTLTQTGVLWQLANDVNFNYIAQTSTDINTMASGWTVQNLLPATKYYLRVSHQGSNGQYSNWSYVYEFDTVSEAIVGRPSVISPINNTADVDPSGLLFESTAFNPINLPTASHVASDWEIATDAGFTNVVYSSYADAVNLLSWTPSGLMYQSIYYARVRHRSDVIGTTGTTYSEWSSAVLFTTMADNREVVQPTILSPINSEVLGSLTPTIYGTQFEAVNYSDTHLSTDWEVSLVPTFASVVWSSYNNTSSLTNVTVGVTLAYNTTYYVRVRYKGSIKISAWSETISFSSQNNPITQYVPKISEAKFTQAYTDNSSNDGGSWWSGSFEFIFDNYTAGSEVPQLVFQYDNTPDFQSPTYTSPVRNADVTGYRNGVWPTSSFYITSVDIGMGNLNTGGAYWYKAMIYNVSQGRYTPTTKVYFGTGTYLTAPPTWYPSHKYVRFKYIVNGVSTAWSTPKKIYTVGNGQVVPVEVESGNILSATANTGAWPGTGQPYSSVEIKIPSYVSSFVNSYSEISLEFYDSFTSSSPLRTVFYSTINDDPFTDSDFNTDVVYSGNLTSPNPIYPYNVIWNSGAFMKQDSNGNTYVSYQLSEAGGYRLDFIGKYVRARYRTKTSSGAWVYSNWTPRFYIASGSAPTAVVQTPSIVSPQTSIGLNQNSTPITLTASAYSSPDPLNVHIYTEWQAVMSDNGSAWYTATWQVGLGDPDYVTSGNLTQRTIGYTNQWHSYKFRCRYVGTRGVSNWSAWSVVINMSYDFGNPGQMG